MRKGFVTYVLVLLVLGLVCACDEDKDNEVLADGDQQLKPSEGYVLYSFIGDKTTRLIDTEGVSVKEWNSNYNSAGAYYLAENKNLLRMGVTPNAKAGTFAEGGGLAGLIEELDDNNNVVWSLAKDDELGTFHHDFKEIDAQNLIALSWQAKEYNGKTYWNENILIIDKNTKTVVWEWSAMEDGAIYPQSTDKADYLHFNSVDYKDGSIVVSARNQNKLYLIDKVSKALRAVLSAEASLSGQHDASFLDSGNILLFNNNAGNNKSSILEINRSDEVVWQYSGDFYSNHISGVCRLESGNTLICSGVEARLIELTSEKEVVWDYTPEKPNTSKPSEIFKVRKYLDY